MTPPNSIRSFIVAALAPRRRRARPGAGRRAARAGGASRRSASGDAGEPEIALDVDREIDLANIVTSAAKGVTTVQEAPAIITVITADEIKQRGFQLHRRGARHRPRLDRRRPRWATRCRLPMVRGVSQAALLLHDGISMFDPWANIAWLDRTQPLENIKRIEVVTGPGGVLWGANSFLGISTSSPRTPRTSTASRSSAGYGDGPGNKQDFRPTRMFGKTFFNGKLKIFQHVSYENFSAPSSTAAVPRLVAGAAAGRPRLLRRAMRRAIPQRSWMLTVDGKYSFGPVSLYYMLPFGDMHPQLASPTRVVTQRHTGPATTATRSSSTRTASARIASA